MPLFLLLLKLSNIGAVEGLPILNPGSATTDSRTGVFGVLLTED